VSTTEQICDKVRQLPDPAQSALLRLVELMADGMSTQPQPSDQPAKLPRTFQDLVETWRRETAFLSFIHQRAMHPAYQRIIGMGWVAVPFILGELARRPDHWFWALRSITGEEPAPDAQSFSAAVEAWLRWGRERGLLPDATG
jgi:hypothetical protein